MKRTLRRAGIALAAGSLVTSALVAVAPTAASADSGFLDMGSGKAKRREVGQNFTINPRKLAYVPPQHSPAYACTVTDAVLMARASHLGTFARPGRTDYAAAAEALATLSIAALANRPITELSGGERQLVMIARAIAQQAPILVLDEPTASLDFGNRVRVLRELDRLRARGMTILFSTHEPDQALAHADRALLLADGRPFALDTADRALTAANIERLYGMPVRLLPVDGRRFACVPIETGDVTSDTSADRAVARNHPAR